MTLLGGLFHKRHSPQKYPTATESVASSPGNRDSTDGDYVLPDRPPPIYSLPAAASSSKLKLPFRRKAAVTQPDTFRFIDSHHSSSVTSDPGHDLPPPPRKSSLFAVYNSSFHSVHSLPHESSSHVHSDTPTRPSSIDIHTEPPSAVYPLKKSQGLFSWARERTKSKPLLPPSTLSSVASTTPAVQDSSSFNLKSFRHVRADSTTDFSLPQPSPNSLPPPPVPRPRGSSAASDSSQRISVAAFREAQARSRANSPVLGSRLSSTADTLRVDGNGRKRASTVSVVSSTERPLLNTNVTLAPMPSFRPESSALDTSSDESDSEEDEEVDSDGEPVPKPVRKRTITRRIDGIRARSDAGHSPLTTSNDQLSQDPPKLSKSALQSDQAPFTRSRASLSTSALTPSGAAPTASALAATDSSSGSLAKSMAPPPKPKLDSDESTNSSDTDSEDMPLFDLVPPRRPGSVTSNQSSGRPRMPVKPLIDINSLAGHPPLLTPILRHENSVKNFNTKRKEQDVEKDQPFSIPAVLALSSSTSPPISSSVSNQSSAPPNKPTHYHKASNDMSTPVKPEGGDNDEDLVNAIRLVGALEKEQNQSFGTPKPFDRIVPTPIRAREPPTSFTVLSRPPQRQGITETKVSSASQTRSNTGPLVLSPRPEVSARQHEPTTTKPAAQNDKSDAISIASAARSSTSQTSSRIPPVPLIHSIPDSPSVKEDHKSGRPRSTSVVNTAESRPQAPPTTLVSPAPDKSPLHRCQPSSAPRRPFASNHSIRGESPAGSSTGDSSSGRSPFTPRDGSDIGARSKGDASDVGPTLKARRHCKTPSVTFEDSPPVRGREWAKTEITSEQRTRERRRSEAKAALELGKIVNGRGPLVHDDSDDDVRMHSRNPTINATMENGMHGTVPGWPAWQQPTATGVTPMGPPQFGNDPTFFAAHQRALLVAKQAYQMAVAQHAMQMAGEEWERSSNVGFGSGGSVYGGGGSVYGGGSGGSVYGGGSGGSVYGGVGGRAGMPPMGVMGMPNMGMLMPPNQWPRSSVVFPGAATSSVYGGISSSQSEYGGGGGWSSRSVFGDSFGPPSSRPNYIGNGGPSSSASAYGGGSRPRARTGVSPLTTSSRTPGKSAAQSRPGPPSSWKNGR